MQEISYRRAFLYYLLAAFILLIACEVILRLCDVEPFRIQAYAIKATPDFCLTAHPKYGFALRPGAYEVQINEAVRYHCTHNADSLRITLRTPEPSLKNDLRIDLHGCSFVYGMGVDDEQTYPWLLQADLPDYQINNFAVPGYGNLQALLHLQQQIAEGDLPDLLVLHYAAFHDERNTLADPYRLALHYGFKNAHPEVQPSFVESRIPWLDNDQTIQYEQWADLYHSWPGREQLALVNSVQTVYEWITYPKKKIESSTHALLLRISQLCRQHGVGFMVAFITDDDRSREVMAYCQNQHIATVDMGLPLPSEKWSQLPHDIHPNARAHQHYAQQMQGALDVFLKKGDSSTLSYPLTTKLR